jgi:hypothetical protein
VVTRVLDHETTRGAKLILVRGLSDELNAAVFDTSFATRLLGDFEQDIKDSKRLDLESWRSRSFHIRGREKMWSYFGEVF